MRHAVNYTNSLVAELEGSKPLLPKSAIEHDPEEDQSNSNPHNVFPEDTP
jgi:hypothetical protein